MDARGFGTVAVKATGTDLNQKKNAWAFVSNHKDLVFNYLHFVRV